MKILVNVMVALICAHILASTLTASSEGQGAADSRAGDAGAIRAIISRLQEGWNSGSGKVFAESFAEDADYVIVNGMRIKGRSAIDAGHQQIFDTIYKNSNLSASVQSIRFLCEEVAIAHIEWHLKFGDPAAPHSSKAMNTMVLTKKGGKWSIAAFHNTPIISQQK